MFGKSIFCVGALLLLCIALPVHADYGECGGRGCLTRHGRRFDGN